MRLGRQDGPGAVLLGVSLAPSKRYQTLQASRVQTPLGPQPLSSAQQPQNNPVNL
ncbi:hypothetical protein NTD81_09840 [Pseudomonas sp. 5P_3.1_Bac2]|nr:hypothetical protein [Pseudomonas sp. 5P_3.1_Bac2]